MCAVIGCSTGNAPGAREGSASEIIHWRTRSYEYNVEASEGPSNPFALDVSGHCLDVCVATKIIGHGGKGPASRSGGEHAGILTRSQNLVPCH